MKSLEVSKNEEKKVKQYGANVFFSTLTRYSAEHLSRLLIDSCI